jgi:hypothetical protein
MKQHRWNGSLLAKTVFAAVRPAGAGLAQVTFTGRDASNVSSAPCAVSGATKGISFYNDSRHITIPAQELSQGDH